MSKLNLVLYMPCKEVNFKLACKEVKFKLACKEVKLIVHQSTSTGFIVAGLHMRATAHWVRRTKEVLRCLYFTMCAASMVGKALCEGVLMNFAFVLQKRVCQSLHSTPHSQCVQAPWWARLFMRACSSTWLLHLSLFRGSRYWHVQTASLQCTCLISERACFFSLHDPINFPTHGVWCGGICLIVTTTL